MKADELRTRVLSRMASLPNDSGQRKRALLALLRGMATVGKPGKR